MKMPEEGETNIIQTIEYETSATITDDEHEKVPQVLRIKNETLTENEHLIEADPAVDETTESIITETTNQSNEKSEAYLSTENLKQLKIAKSEENPRNFQNKLEQHGNPKLELGPCKMIKNKQKIMKITCQICGKMFETKEKGQKVDTHIVVRYKEHYKIHEIDAIDDCGCNMTFESKLQKRFHISTVHEKLHGCNNCHSVFKSQGTLVNHMKIHDKVLKCEYCPYEVRMAGKTVSMSNYSLKKHIRSKHHNSVPPANARKLMECSHCEKEGITRQFSEKAYLNSHIRKVHTPETCMICGLTVKMLDRHMKNKHTADAEKRFHCEDCGKAFSIKHTLRAHRDSLHLGVQFTCRYDKCDRVYRDRSNRDAHEKKSHGGLFHLMKQS